MPFQGLLTQLARRRFGIVGIFFYLPLMLFFSACTSETNDNSLTVGRDVKSNFNAFAETTYPLLAEFCSDCHATGQQKDDLPLADASLELAYNTLLDNDLIDLVTAEASYIVSYIADGHQCVDEECLTRSESLAESILQWRDTVDSRFSDGVNPEDDLTAFSDSLHPLLIEHCSNCHALGSGNPVFADQDSFISYNTAVSLVDLDEIENSRFITRIRDDGHGCWNDCTSDAEEMTQAINNWATSVTTFNF